MADGLTHDAEQIRDAVPARYAAAARDVHPTAPSGCCGPAADGCGCARAVPPPSPRPNARCSAPSSTKYMVRAGGRARGRPREARWDGAERPAYSFSG
jgi:hypothetical protein